MSAQVEFADEVAGCYFRSVLLENVGDRGEQHVHDYDHATLCGRGAAKVFVDGIYARMVSAGEAVLVKAGRKHAFEALQPGTRLTCVHIAESALAAKDTPLMHERT